MFIEHEEKAADAAFSISGYWYFSDPVGGEEGLLQEIHKNQRIVVMR